MKLEIRSIEAKDNPALKRLVMDTLSEFGCIGPGYASGDPELDFMYEYYQQPDSAFYVVEDVESSEVLGCGGFSRLKGTTPEEAVCEFQKFYFSPKLRGKGMGKKLIAFALAEAKNAGYKEAYLETIPKMTVAIALYEKMGFELLPTHRGATGHHERCPIRMGLKLDAVSTVIPCA